MIVDCQFPIADFDRTFVRQLRLREIGNRESAIDND
jgi:hypothetical protein